MTAQAGPRLVAAINCTQRLRTMLACCHTRRFHAAAGTVNRLK